MHIGHVLNAVSYKYLILLIIIILFLILSIFDIQTKQIPVWILVIFSLIMISYNVILYLNHNFLLIQLIINLIPGLLFLLIAILSPKHIGLGDGIVLLIIGGLLERQFSMYIIMGGLLLNSIYCIIMLMIRKLNWTDKIPFLPFLTLSSITLLIYNLILDIPI